MARFGPAVAYDVADDILQTALPRIRSITRVDTGLLKRAWRISSLGVIGNNASNSRGEPYAKYTTNDGGTISLPSAAADIIEQTAQEILPEWEGDFYLMASEMVAPLNF